MKKLKPDIIKKLKMASTARTLDCKHCPLNDRDNCRSCLSVLREEIEEKIIERYLPINHLYCCEDVKNACYQMWKDLEPKRAVKI